MPCRFPENLPNPGIKPGSPTLQADSLPFEPPGKPSGHLGCFRALAIVNSAAMNIRVRISFELWFYLVLAPLVAQMVKNLPAMWETQV